MSYSLHRSVYTTRMVSSVCHEADAAKIRCHAIDTTERWRVLGIVNMNNNENGKKIHRLLIYAAENAANELYSQIRIRCSHCSSFKLQTLSERQWQARTMWSTLKIDLCTLIMISLTAFTANFFKISLVRSNGPPQMEDMAYRSRTVAVRPFGYVWELNILT